MGRREYIFCFPLLLHMAFAFALLNCLCLDPQVCFSTLFSSPCILLRRGVTEWLVGNLVSSQGQSTIPSSELSHYPKYCAVQNGLGTAGWEGFWELEEILSSLRGWVPQDSAGHVQGSLGVGAGEVVFN